MGWETYRWDKGVDKGYINLIEAYSKEYMSKIDFDSEHTVAFDYLIEVQRRQKIRSRQVAAIALATANALNNLNCNKQPSVI